MASFRDLESYPFGKEGTSGRTALNVGWLGKGSSFETAPPGRLYLERLWRYCSVSVIQTRGLHRCELCDSDEANYAQKGTERLKLGSAEVRVVGLDGTIYAAPNLIYHYSSVHNYVPPNRFVLAVLSSPCPPDEEYFRSLSALGIEWTQCLTHDGRPDQKFKFVKTQEGEIVCVEVK